MTDVEKQATNLVAWMTSLRVDFDNDLATLAGPDERSTAKLRDVNERKQVIDIIVKDIDKMLQNCIGKNDLINEIIGGVNDIPDGLLERVDELEANIAQRAFKYIMADPSMPTIMLKNWGVEWSQKIDGDEQDSDF